MNAIKWWLAFCLVFIIGNACSVHADTGIDGSATTSSSFTMTGPVYLSTLTVSNSLSVSTITAVSSATITNATINKLTATAAASALGATTFSGSINFSSTSLYGIIGSTVSDNAAAGNVGEYVSSFVSAASPVTFGSGYGNITSITLSSGDWTVDGMVGVAKGSGAITFMLGYITTSSGRIAATGDLANNGFSLLGPTTAYDVIGSIPGLRFSLNSTTTLYLEGEADSTTAGFYGRISARRTR